MPWIIPNKAFLDNRPLVMRARPRFLQTASTQPGFNAVLEDDDDFGVQGTERDYEDDLPSTRLSCDALQAELDAWDAASDEAWGIGIDGVAE
jgi:hypothetical protein